MTGRVLHLSVWASDRPGTALLPGTGRYAPLCALDRPVPEWIPTGPWREGWARHSHWPVCHRCVRAMDRLLADLTEQDDRHDAYLPPDLQAARDRDEQIAAEYAAGDAASTAAFIARVAMADAVAARTNPDCAAGKHAACSGTAWDDLADSLTTCACCDSRHALPERTDT